MGSSPFNIGGTPGTNYLPPSTGGFGSPAQSSSPSYAPPLIGPYAQGGGYQPQQQSPFGNPMINQSFMNAPPPMPGSNFSLMNSPGMNYPGQGGMFPSMPGMEIFNTSSMQYMNSLMGKAGQAYASAMQSLATAPRNNQNSGSSGSNTSNNNSNKTSNNSSNASGNNSRPAPEPPKFPDLVGPQSVGGSSSSSSGSSK